MKIYIDTANLDEIRRANRMGILSGVTTNPSLLAKENISDFKAHLKTICEEVDGPVSGEITATEPTKMIEQAEKLAAIHKNMVIKVPINEVGLEVTHALYKKGIRVNMTLIFSATQGLLAARAGAFLLSPFVGRLDDIAHEGMEIIHELVAIIEQDPELDSMVLAASIRHPRHVVDAALAGAHVATIPFKVINQLLQHPLTDIGIQKFEEDWKKAFGGKEW
jgi:transaldolase